MLRVTTYQVEHTSEKTKLEPPPRVTEGLFAGSRGMHNYCVHCSKDLCEECMKERRCPDSDDQKHEPEME